METILDVQEKTITSSTLEDLLATLIAEQIADEFGTSSSRTTRHNTQKDTSHG